MNNSDEKLKRKLIVAGIALFIIAILFAIVGIFAASNNFSNSKQAAQQDNVRQSKKIKQTRFTNPKQESISNSPTQDQAQQALNSVKNQLPSNVKYNQHGAFILNNNVPDLTLPDNKDDVFAKTSIDDKKRPQKATALLNKSTRQTNPRNEPKDIKFKPVGYHQLTNLPGKFKFAYNRGHLLGYALVGNLKNFDKSESNQENIITETSWANQALLPEGTGQNYYENLIKKQLDKGRTVYYEVTPIYSSENKVTSGIHIQAKSTDDDFKLNVFVPNVQRNLIINYQDGKTTSINQ